MKIGAMGANRRVNLHTVMDAKIEKVDISKGEISFNLLSNMDPGIGQGQYVLSFSISKQEAILLFECAMSLDSNEKIKKLEREIAQIKDALEKASRSKTP